MLRLPVIVAGAPVELQLDDAAVATLAAAVAGAPRPMTRQAYARHIGKSLRTVDKKLAAGMPRTKTIGGILIDPVDADQWRKTYRPRRRAA